MNQRKENGKEKQNRQYNKKNIIIIGFYIICRRGWSLGSSHNTLSHTNKAGKGAILSIYKKKKK